MRIRPVLLALALILPLGAQAQPPSYTIFTVAGSLNLPTDVALDKGGNLYFCDWSGRIFKLAAATGLVTTVAGTGSPGYSGDGGPATKAQLGGPGSLAIDTAGNIFFGDPYNHRVRMVSAATGIITTVAGSGSEFDSGDGGPALNAGIAFVEGVTLDAEGDLYFTNAADRVRKVTARTGIITTVAGQLGSSHGGDGGPAALAHIYQPSGLAVDRDGNLYIAARGEHRIRKVSAATGIITTIAGNSPGANSGVMGIGVYQGGFGGDGGPATSALLNDPERIALDSAGNIYVADTQNFRIRRIDAVTGTISTIAGTGVKGYGGDGGAAVNAGITYPAGILADAVGRVYFADESNQRIRVLLPDRPPRRPQFHGGSHEGPQERGGIF